MRGGISTVVEAPSQPSPRQSVQRDTALDTRSEVSSIRTVRGGSRLPAEYGLVRDDKIPLANMINFARIERGASRLF